MRDFLALAVTLSLGISAGCGPKAVDTNGVTVKEHHPRELPSPKAKDKADR